MLFACGRDAGGQPERGREALASATIPTASAEFPIGEPRYTTDVLSGIHEIAFGRNAYLATHLRGISLRGGTDWLTLVSLFRSDGTVVGSPERLSTQVSTARVAFGSNHWVVVWHKAQPTNPGELACLRIGEDGNVLAPAATLEAPSTALPTKLVSAGTELLLVWDSVKQGRVLRDDCSYSGAQFALPEGSRLDSAAFDGTAYWLLYDIGNPPELRAQRVSKAGTLDGQPLLVGSPLQGEHYVGEIASSNGSSLIAYASGSGPDIDVGFDQPATLRYRTLSPSGVLGPEFTSSGSVTSDDPLLTAHGNGFVAGGWVECCTLGVRQIAADGTVVGSASTAEWKQRPSQFVSDGTNVLVVGPSGGTDNGACCAKRLDATLQPIDPWIDVSSVAFSQYRPLVAFDGRRYQALWTEDELRSTRLSTEGTMLDPRAVSVSNGALPTGFNRAFASNGDGFLAAWVTNQAYIQARPIDADGVPVGSGPFAAMPRTTTTSYEGFSGISIGSNGADYLLVAGHSRYDGTSRVEAVRITSAGVVLDQPPLNVSTPSSAANAVAFNGTDYVVASSNPVRIARVSSTGSLLGVVTTALAGDVQGLEWSQGQGLLVWEARSPFRLMATRVSPSGELLDPEGFLISTQDPWEAKVAWDGTQYWVVWLGPEVSFARDVYAARVTPTGQVLDPEGTIVLHRPVPGEPGYSYAANHLGLASGDGKVLAVRERFDGSPEYWSPRLRGSFLTSGPIGGAGGASGAAGAAGAGLGGMAGTPSSGGAGSSGAVGGAAGNGMGGSAGSADGNGGHAGQGAAAATGGDDDGGHGGAGAGDGAAGDDGASGGDPLGGTGGSSGSPAGGEPSSGGQGDAGDSQGGRPTAPPADESGCNCRAGVRPGSHASLLWAGLLGLAAALRRRRIAA